MPETIKCGNCEKDSGIEPGARDGVSAAKLQHIGWQVKLPVLVGIAEWLFACSGDCLNELRAKKYAEHNVSDEQIKDANEIVEKMKSRIPEMAKEVCQKMDRLQKVLRKERSI